MRLSELSPGTMTDAQRAVYGKTVAGKHGRMVPPVAAWLHSPELARRAQSLGEFIRFDTTLPPALAELAILVTARYWGSHYEWYAHRKLALAAGLDADVINAILHRRVPDLADSGARAIYDYATTLHCSRNVSQVLHDAVVVSFGEQGVIELVGLLGYYTMVSMTLNVFAIGLPNGELSELSDT